MGLEQDKRNPETEPKRKLQYGIVVSNLANDSNPQIQIPNHTDVITNLLLKNQLGLEFQIESENFYIPNINVYPAFVGLHQPIRGIDFYHTTTRASSIERMKRVLKTAHMLPYALDYIVFHIEPYDYWEDVANRKTRISMAKQWFEELINYHQQEGITIPLLVENLEFPKYPATLEDINDCINWIRSLQYPYLGFAFDFAHLWRSGQLISTNMRQIGVSDWENEWSNQTISFVQLVDKISILIRDDVRLLHVTSGDHEHTHLLPQETQQDTTINMLNGKAMLEYLLGTPALQNKNLFVINEAIGYPYSQTIQTVLTFNRPYEL